MGPRCTTLQLGGNVNIPGNGNSAIIFNGVSYNLSSIVNNGLSVIMEKYRSELIIIQFSSIVLMTILSCAIILYFSFKRAGNKDMKSLVNEPDMQFELNHTRIKSHLLQFDAVLQEIESLLQNNYPLQYFAQPLGYIENVYHLVRLSPDLLSIVITKLIKKNYASRYRYRFSLNFYKDMK
ncbi:unnamed protein product [Adineta ricciae]|uniref:Uncharacterized protein n=1 Tax=Adineta ricciae TaxID=249248 RepID=A0A815TTZ5_ADIRI|nr:unnamed protein product [Adineta ricciae]